MESLDSYSGLKKDLKRISAVYHVCELVDGLCPENQENSAVFHLFKNFLDSLKDLNEWGKELEKFEIELLTILGYFDSNHEIAKINRTVLIERIMERKLKTKQINLC